MARSKKNTRAPWGTVRRRTRSSGRDVARSATYFTASYHYGVAEYRSPITYQTEGDARAWLAKERRLIETGEWTPPAGREAARLEAERHARDALTVAGYAANWLDRATLSPTTRARYAQLLRYYINAEPIPPKTPKGKPRRVTPKGVGGVPVADLTRATVSAWWQALPLATARRSCDLAYSLLHAIMQAATDDGLTGENPCHGIKGAGKASERRDIDTPLNPAQVLAVADAMPARWRLGVLLGAWCALRSGEVRALQRQDIDLQASTITVRRGVVYADRTLTVKEPKTKAGRRTVHIPPAILPDVKAHLLSYAQIGPAGLLFYTRAGTPVLDANWRRAFVRACQRVDEDAQDAARERRAHGERTEEPPTIAGTRFHDLRHVGLTYVATAGATLKELQAIAGHTSPAMAMRYQEVAQGRMVDLAARLSSIIEANG